MDGVLFLPTCRCQLPISGEIRVLESLTSSLEIVRRLQPATCVLVADLMCIGPADLTVTASHVHQLFVDLTGRGGMLIFSRRFPLKT